MSGHERKALPAEERERLAQILKTAFPIGSEGSFTSLLRTLNAPYRSDSRQ